MKSYEDIFNHRATPYHLAMQEFPTARDNEFKLLVDGIRSTERFKRILDIPAGGGYLSRYFADDVDVVGLEFSDGFVQKSESAEVSKVDPNSPGLSPESFDLAICLAALHHVEEKQPFIQAVLRSVKHGGFFCIADVLDESKEAIFLDGFVGEFNGTGHNGDYLRNSLESFESLGNENGNVIRNEYIPCPWHFDNENSLVKFTRNLFGLTGVSDQRVLQELVDQIGITRTESDLCLNWSLLYVTYERV